MKLPYLGRYREIHGRYTEIYGDIREIYGDIREVYGGDTGDIEQLLDEAAVPG